MDYDRSTVLDWLGQIRSGKSTVCNRGNAMFKSDVRDRFNVCDIESGVAHGLQEKSLGLVSDCLCVISGVLRIDKFYLDSQLGKDVVELGVSAPVKVVGGYDFIPFLGKVDYRVKHATGSGSKTQSCCSPSMAATRCSKTSVVGFIKRV